MASRAYTSSGEALRIMISRSRTTEVQWLPSSRFNRTPAQVEPDLDGPARFCARRPFSRTGLAAGEICEKKLLLENIKKNGSFRAAARTLRMAKMGRLAVIEAGRSRLPKGSSSHLQTLWGTTHSQDRQTSGVLSPERLRGPPFCGLLGRATIHVGC